MLAKKIEALIFLSLSDSPQILKFLLNILVFHDKVYICITSMGVCSSNRMLAAIGSCSFQSPTDKDKHTSIVKV